MLNTKRIAKLANCSKWSMHSNFSAYVINKVLKVQRQTRDFNLPDTRRLSSNWEIGTNWVWFLLPLHPVRCLWAFTQGRLHERMEQPGQLYFHGLDLHSSHNFVSLHMLLSFSSIRIFLLSSKTAGEVTIATATIEQPFKIGRFFSHERLKYLHFLAPKITMLDKQPEYDD